MSSRGRLSVTNDAATRLIGPDIVRYSRIAVCVTSGCSETIPWALSAEVDCTFALAAQLGPASTCRLVLQAALCLHTGDNTLSQLGLGWGAL